MCCSAPTLLGETLPYGVPAASSGDRCCLLGCFAAQVVLAPSRAMLAEVSFALEERGRAEGAG